MCHKVTDRLFGGNRTGLCHSYPASGRQSGTHRAASEALAIGILAAILAGCGGDAPEPEASYVGTDACAECHGEVTRSWRGSHHDRAMQPATEETVLGDFDGAEIVVTGVTSRFFRQDGAFVVRTRGPDGEPADFPVAFTLGVEPLQQYVVPFPGGRYQVLSLAWDSRRADQGGQRWFDLGAGAPWTAGGSPSWTGPDMRWNGMCAECHVTDLRKGYDPATDTYRTRWSEGDVACEACHGPGSRHIQLVAPRPGEPSAAGEHSADIGLDPDLRTPPGGWAWTAGDSIARRTEPLPDRREAETCARCHARRVPLTEGAPPGTPLYQSHRLRLLDPGFYHADGQILDEVFVYGSFLQSRMYAAGVRCSDCHDPHSLELRREGNDLCAGCHRPEVFAVAEHHRHPADSPGSRCVACHMPATTYMAVDPRRDHSFRIPRPESSLETGAPDACTRCHEDRNTTWAAESVQAWRGAAGGLDESGLEAARALHAGRQRLPGAAALLRGVAEDGTTSGIVRATALALLAAHPSRETVDALIRAGDDPDPLVRSGAVAALEGMPVGTRLRVALPLLEDSTRTVRIEAARVLAPVDRSAMPPEARERVEAASLEYEEALLARADHPEARVARGDFEMARGRPVDAERAYRSALDLDPDFAPAYLNLADLYRAMGREPEATDILDRALHRWPGDPAFLHARGLQLVRLGRREDALADLRSAARSAPGEPRYARALAVALVSSGDPGSALTVVEEALRWSPWDRSLLFLAAAIQRDGGEIEEALAYARRLLRVAPDDPGARELVRSLGGS